MPLWRMDTLAHHAPASLPLPAQVTDKTGADYRLIDPVFTHLLNSFTHKVSPDRLYAPLRERYISIASRKTAFIDRPSRPA
jgi:hypothetical protein